MDFVRWFRDAWGPIDQDLPLVEPPYPGGPAELAFEVGVVTLASQQSQSQALDQKLAVGAALSLGIVALIPTVLAISRREIAESEAWFGLAAGIVLALAFAHSLRGMWVRTFRSTPDQVELWDQADSDYRPDRLRWAAAASIRQAIEVNDRVLATRLGAFKIVWTLLLVGSILSLSALILHLAG